MPLFSFQVRAGDQTHSHDTWFRFHDVAQAVEIALFSMVDRPVLNATMSVMESVLEVVDEDGTVVASLPIADVMTRH